ncbi:hypothetical protein GCM10011513_30470 [Franconibacter daqui]|uniref:DUF3289 family protein n=1 Tax=Franconibacter daqui TaxID=2047724 RepID=UPI001666549A|nr:DUF3289 family protein [Franconibacter daqui]GGD30837.1 hypothetical protein GCM10011513_30470 [Franconibacter daqui]
MVMATFPLTIYQTRRGFNDVGADDMRYGDISQEQLIKRFRLTAVSNVIDPYTLTRLTPFNTPQSRFAGVYGNRNGGQLSVHECARLLFEELQATSLPFAFYGPYRQLINQMLTHLYRSTGAPWRDARLDLAYRNQILRDNSKNSTRIAIKQVIDTYIDYQQKGYPGDKVFAFAEAIRDKILPKFDSFIDKINGMGVCVHDVHATQIKVLSLKVEEKRWRAKILFQGQDHFGLGIEDIQKRKFMQLQFFRIWFILQRFNRFGFRPFLTNMEAVIDLEGGSR